MVFCLPSYLVLDFSVKILSRFVFLASLTSSTSFPSFLSLSFRFFLENQLEIDSLWFNVLSINNADACKNPKCISGRLKTGYPFEIYQHFLRMIKHDGHDFLQSVSVFHACFVVPCLNLYVSFFQSTSMKISQCT